MASGERGQKWYPEVLDILRARWRRDLTCIDLRDLRLVLQAELDRVRRDRQIVPPVFRCPNCGQRHAAADPEISVRAMLIAVRRFEIDDAAFIRTLERA